MLVAAILAASVLLFAQAATAVVVPAVEEAPPPTDNTDNSTIPDVVAPDDLVASTWYAGWHADDFPLANVSWQKYTHVTYAFATTTPNVTQLNVTDADRELLPQFVAMAHENDVKAAISIGGWTGSQFFSTAVATPQNRTAFVKTVTGLAEEFELDGIDFDWEYLNKQGIGCNTISRNDTDNFLAFLQELRATPTGEALYLTAAVTGPFINASGLPSDNVTAFSEVLDHIAIMNYDLTGSWAPSVGPNAPINDTCAPATQRQGSAVSMVSAWVVAGMPITKIVLGVPAYGHSFSVPQADAFNVTTRTGVTSPGVPSPPKVPTTLASFPAFNKTDQPAGDGWDDPAAVDVCGVQEPQAGVFNFWGMVDKGFLTPQGTAAEGIEYRFDNCSRTSFVYNSTSEVMISFDDAPSFAAKGEFIKTYGLRGFAMWEAGGDFEDILLDSIRESAGFPELVDCPVDGGDDGSGDRVVGDIPDEVNGGDEGDEGDEGEEDCEEVEDDGEDTGEP